MTAGTQQAQRTEPPEDVIVTGGLDVSAAEVERAILACGDVRECAVIGLPDGLWGERVSAVVVLHAGARQSAESIVRHCRERLPAFKTPKQVILLDHDLPRTPDGAVRKRMLAEAYGGLS